MKLLLALLISYIGVANGEQYQRIREELSSKISNLIDTRLSETLYAENGIQRGNRIEIQKQVQPVSDTIKQNIEIKTYEPNKSQYFSKQQQVPLYKSVTYSTSVNQILPQTPVTQTFVRNEETIQPIKTNYFSTTYSIPKNTESNINILSEQIVPSAQTTNYRQQTVGILGNTNYAVKSKNSLNNQQMKKSNHISITPSLSVTQYEKQLQEKKQHQQQQLLRNQQRQSIVQRIEIPQVIQIPQKPVFISSPSSNVVVGAFKDTNHVEGKGNIIGSRSNSLAKGNLLDLDFENTLGKDFDKKFIL